MTQWEHGGPEPEPASGDVVVRDGCVHWHTRPTCEVRDAREGVVAYGCSLRDAWASCLLPCPSCSGGQATVAAARWGSRTRVERARLTLPVLRDLVSGVAIVPLSPHTAEAPRNPAAAGPEHTPSDQGLVVVASSSH
ncbi:MAG: hypothetical protein M3Y71_13755 [Actinomycetota bacterium]|nr:hypothetical protein [Actinomycetota bacterium]